MRTIIPLSCGKDSTYVLWRYLRDTNREITAVHTFVAELSEEQKIINRVTLQGKLNGSHYSAAQAKRIVQWLSDNVRTCRLEIVEPTKEVSSTHDEPLGGASSFGMTWAIYQINNGNYDTLVNTHEREDDSRGWERKVSQTASSACRRSLDEFQRLAKRGSIEFPLINWGYNQSYAMTELPKDLLALTFSCDRSVEPCGTCFKCSKTKLIGRMLEGGMSPVQIGEHYERQCKQKDGSWWSMKDWLQQYIPECCNTFSKHTYQLINDVSDWSVPETLR